jgi:TonB family protein
MRRTFLLSAATVLAAFVVVPQFAHAQHTSAGGAEIHGATELSRPPQFRDPVAAARQVARAYPASLRATRDSGTATVEFVIDAKGQVEPGSATVVGSSALIFGDAAKAVVEHMDFVPPEIKGKPARVRAAMPFVFKP